MRKAILYMVLCIVLVAVLSSFVSAIGISPAKSAVELNHDTPIGEGRIRVLNNEHKEMRVLIEPHGHLSEYITFSRTDFVMGPEQAEDYVEYSINMSDVSLADMRTTKIKIYVIEIPTAISFSGSGMSTGTAAIHKLTVSFPYESPIPKEKVEEQKPVGNDYEEGSADLDYVPLEDNEKIVEKKEESVAEPEKPKNMLVYIVITLIALNLLWVIFLFRKKDGKPKNRGEK